MVARMASGLFLALGFADLAVLNLLLAPRLSEQAARAAGAEIARAVPREAAVPRPAAAVTACPPVGPALPSPAPAATGAPEAPPDLPLAATPDVIFELGEVRVPGGRAGDVRQVADALRAAPDRRLLLRGHADRLGSSASNRELSRQRAEAVRRLLFAYGAPVERVAVEAVGEDEPASGDDTPIGWAHNRRVQLLWR